MRGLVLAEARKKRWPYGNWAKLVQGQENLIIPKLLNTGYVDTMVAQRIVENRVVRWSVYVCSYVPNQNLNRSDGGRVGRDRAAMDAPKREERFTAPSPQESVLSNGGRSSSNERTELTKGPAGLEHEWAKQFRRCAAKRESKASVRFGDAGIGKVLKPAEGRIAKRGTALTGAAGASVPSYAVCVHKGLDADVESSAKIGGRGWNVINVSGDVIRPSEEEQGVAKWQPCIKALPEGLNRSQRENGGDKGRGH